MSCDPVPLVREQDVVALAQALIRIPSQYIEDTLTQHEEIAVFLQRHMESIGLEVTKVEAVSGFPIVVGTTPGGEDGPVFGVIGHYSTVAVGDLDEWTMDPFGAEMLDGKLYGRGSADQKGGIAAVLVAARAFLASGCPRQGKLRLLMVPGEGCTEMALEPVVETTPELLRCDAYVDSDGGPGAISLVYGGWIWMKLRVKGKGGHTGALTSERLHPVNPVQKLITVFNTLRHSRWMTSERHPLFGPEFDRYSPDPICEVTVFDAGSKVNIIPNHAEGQICIRMLPAQTPAGVLGELDAVLDDFRANDPELDISYRILGISKNPREVPPDYPVVQIIQATCEEMGAPIPRLVGNSGGGRASLAKLGPVLHFGAGGGANGHAPNEYANIAEIYRAAQLHARLYSKLLGGITL